MLRHAIASRFGDFTLFNVPSGALTLNGYKRGQQLEPTPVDTREGSIASAVLERSDVPLGSVSGNVKVVNAPGGALTSVVLVPQSVFDARLERGPIPLGLRAPGLFELDDHQSPYIGELALIRNEESAARHEDLMWRSSSAAMTLGVTGRAPRVSFPASMST